MITSESLKARIVKLRIAESEALANANAQAGAIAMCEELLRELEGPGELTLTGVGKMFGAQEIGEPEQLNGSN